MGNPLGFFDKSSCIDLWQSSVNHLNNFPWRYQQAFSQTRHENYWSLLYLSKCPSAMHLPLPSFPLPSSSSQANLGKLPGYVGLQLVQVGWARAVDFGLQRQWQRLRGGSRGSEEATLCPSSTFCWSLCPQTGCPDTSCQPQKRSYI